VTRSAKVGEDVNDPTPVDRGEVLNFASILQGLWYQRLPERKITGKRLPCRQAAIMRPWIVVSEWGQSIG
jgi:hypothetical protein